MTWPGQKCSVLGQSTIPGHQFIFDTTYWHNFRILLLCMAVDIINSLTISRHLNKSWSLTPRMNIWDVRLRSGSPQKPSVGNLQFIENFNLRKLWRALTCVSISAQDIVIACHEEYSSKNWKSTDGHKCRHGEHTRAVPCKQYIHAYIHTIT